MGSYNDSTLAHQWDSTTVKIINLGCGTTTSASPDVVNVDWSMYLRIRRSALLRLVAPIVIRGERWNRYQSLRDNVLVHDLRKGIPFPSNSVDVVYHSHLLEHLERSAAEHFLTEVHRVLVPGGIHRLVVPDLELLARNYLEHIELCTRNPEDSPAHDQFVARIIEQCVRTESAGTREQRPLRKWLENSLLGDARGRGEAHRWMYDRINLSVMLLKTGFENPRVHTFQTSGIPHWESYQLDSDEHGRPHKRRSLYLEAEKPTVDV
jgi:SAM-dependent methyltransferase